VNEAATLAGLQHQAIRRAIARGDLQAMKLCGRVRIEPRAFDAWCSAHTMLPHPNANVDAPTYKQPASAPTGLKRLLDK
jgi:hypothetical protein